jgi:hypothetical protein
MKLPQRGMDALADWLSPKAAAPVVAPVAAPVASRADDMAAQVADVAAAQAPPPSNVVPMKPQPKPAQDWIVEDTGQMKHVDSQIDAMGKGGDGPPMPKNQDPDFLRKSQELADMLKADADTVVDASIYPGARGPDIKHKGAYRGQQFRFPNAEKRIGNSEGMDLSLDPRAQAEFASREKPTSTLDDLLFGDPSVEADRAFDMLDAGERGMSKARDPWNVDSRQFRSAPANAEAVADVADKPTRDIVAGKRPAAVAESYPDTVMTDAASWDDQLEAMGKPRMGEPNWSSEDELAEIMSTVNAQGAQNLQGAPMQRTLKPSPKPIEVGADDAAAKAQAVEPWNDEAIDSARQAGYQRVQKAAGWVGEKIGSAVGAAAGNSFGGLLGGMVGAGPGGDIGRKIGEGAVKAFSPEKVAQRMAKDPAMLARMKAQGGELGRAAAFVEQGLQEAGEAGLKARAFVLAMMPQFREQFAQER